MDPQMDMIEWQIKVRPHQMTGSAGQQMKLSRI